jgi:hypothetical protein
MAYVAEFVPVLFPKATDAQGVDPEEKKMSCLFYGVRGQQVNKIHNA